VGQAKLFSKEIVAGVKRASSIEKQLILEGLRQELDAMVPLIKRVMKQTRARIFRGETRAGGKILRAVDRNHPQGQGGQAQRVR
jgi:IS5 family transposase